MKKLSIVFASLLVVAMVFSSCKKEESTGVNNTGKATISGKVYMNYDVSVSNDQDELAPAGTQLIAEIDAADLVQDGDGTANYGTKTYYTTVDANGEYSFTIDAGANAVNVTIKGVDVMHSRTTYVANGVDGNGNTIWDPVVDNDKVWSTNGTAAALVNKDIKFRDITYN